MRQTSIDAYNAVRNNGVIGKLQLKVYDYLYNHGPCTTKQMLVALVPDETTDQGNYRTRLSELKRMGLVHDIGTVKCEHTGQKILLWDVTNKILESRIKKTLQDQFNHIVTRIEKLQMKKDKLAEKIKKQQDKKNGSV